MPILKPVYVEKSEKLLWENNEHFQLMQKTYFMNVVSILEYTLNMMCKEQILLM